ncbi:MAG TPA: flagellin [Methanosarcinaceae archaeon]|nr:flagellin [Methanosarcinaceae archaeon]
MKANNKIFIRTDTRAQVGIGTLIIFIAMVLVAAVAAAVLIQTSGVLQQKAQTTGMETVQEVASNIEVTQIIGVRNATTPGNDLEQLELTMKVMAGADAIDVGQFVAAMQNKSARIELIEYANGTEEISSAEFYVVELRDEDGSFDPNDETNTVINSGDLITLVFKPGAEMDFPTREPVRIEIKPEFGTSIIREFNTPSSYGVETNVVLYP